MNRVFACGLALFFAVIAFAVVSESNTVVAGHRCNGDCGGRQHRDRCSGNDCCGTASACDCSCRGGLFARMRAKHSCNGADTCCGAPAPSCAPAAPACGCQAAAPSCGCEAAAPSCGCQAAAAPSCGCETAVAAPASCPSCQAGAMSAPASTGTPSDAPPAPPATPAKGA